MIELWNSYIKQGYGSILKYVEDVWKKAKDI